LNENTSAIVPIAEEILKIEVQLLEPYEMLEDVFQE
jgi:hypothetical protein